MKIQAILVGFCVVIALMIGAFSIGWVKRGEVEAGKTAEAYEKGVEEEALKQQEAMGQIIKDVAEQAAIQSQGETAIKEVIKYVETKPDDVECYDVDLMQRFTETLKNP